MLLVLKPPQSGVITPVRSGKTNNIIPAFYLHTPSCKYWVMSVIRPNAFGPRNYLSFFSFSFLRSTEKKDDGRLSVNN